MAERSFRSEGTEDLEGGLAQELGPVVEGDNKEIGIVKTRNRVLLMSTVGAVALGVLGTVVLARQNGFTLPSVSGQGAEQAATPAAPGSRTNDEQLAQADTNAKNAESAKPQAEQQQPQVQQTIFNEHVQKAGVAACKDVFPALGFNAAAGSTFNATTSWNEKNPNRHSISSIVGLGFNSDTFKGLGAALIFSAPTPDKGGCEGMFVRVVPVAQDCATFASGLPKESQLGPTLQGVPVVNLTNGSQVLLLPTAGNGCAVLTTARAQTTLGN